MKKEIIGQPEDTSDKLTETDQLTKHRQSTSKWFVAVLRIASAISLAVAIFTAIGTVLLRLLHLFQPNLLPWTMKSAIPLILVGIAFASLQFILPRTRRQILLGLMVAAAFILWGTEQFVSNQAVASLIDDVVVLLFVIDLGLVTCGHLKSGVHPIGRESPFDEPEV